MVWEYDDVFVVFVFGFYFFHVYSWKFISHLSNHWSVPYPKSFEQRQLPQRRQTYYYIQKALIGAIYQSPCGHRLIDSLIHFPIHLNDQHPPNSGVCFNFLQILIIMKKKKNLCLCLCLCIFLFLNKFLKVFNYIIHINFVSNILWILKPIIHPKLQQWRLLSYQLINFWLERRKLFFSIFKMFISYY